MEDPSIQIMKPEPVLVEAYTPEVKITMNTPTLVKVPKVQEQPKPVKVEKIQKPP